jgi:hypothetical protein
MGIAADRYGNIYVATDFSVLKITPDKTVSTFVSGLNYANALAFDNQGNLFIGYRGGVKSVSPDGTVSTFLDQEIGLGGIVFDSSNNLYGADNWSGKVYKFSPSGQATELASGLSSPLGAALDNKGNLYIADEGNGKIRKIDPSGQMTDYATGLDRPNGITLDSRGNLYVCETHNNVIKLISPSGTISTFASGLNTPWGILLRDDPAGDDDLDAVTNYREEKDGTDPNDPNSFNPLSKGLVAYYPFDGNANDESGYGRNGTVVGATHGYDRFGYEGQSYNFERTNFAHIELPWRADLSQGVTCISFWFFDNDGNTGFILSGEAEYDWSVHVGSLAGTNRLRFLPSVGDGAAPPVFDALETFKPGSWNHAVCISGTQDESVGIWLNGKLISTTVQSGNPSAPSTHVSSKLWIGARQIWPDFQTHYFNGRIDDVRIYNRALSSSEVQQLFYKSAFSDNSRNFLEASPSILGHFNLVEYNANRTNGQIDVTSNPSAFNLFTAEQYNTNYYNGLNTGIGNVLSNPASYNLYTSDSIMDLRMGGLMLQKQGSNAVVTFQPQTTTDLTLPFTNNGTPVTNTIPMPGNKGFLRMWIRDSTPPPTP